MMLSGPLKMCLACTHPAGRSPLLRMSLLLGRRRHFPMTCSQHFPHVKSYVRAHDVNHGLVLEKAGATAVVPETLEPSLQARTLSTCSCAAMPLTA